MFGVICTEKYFNLQEVTCDQDEGLYQTVKTTVNKLHQNLVQVS